MNHAALKRPGLVISWLEGKARLGWLELPADDTEILRLHLVDGIYRSEDGNGFEGFHDWIHDDADLLKSEYLLGIEVFPSDERVETVLRFTGEAGADDGQSSYRIDFLKGAAQGYSGGEQAFWHHQYFLSDAGRVAILVDTASVNEMEREDLLKRAELVEWS